MQVVRVLAQPHGAQTEKEKFLCQLKLRVPTNVSGCNLENDAVHH